VTTPIPRHLQVLLLCLAVRLASRTGTVLSTPKMVLTAGFAPATFTMSMCCANWAAPREEIERLLPTVGKEPSTFYRPLAVGPSPG